MERPETAAVLWQVHCTMYYDLFTTATSNCTLHVNTVTVHSILDLGVEQISSDQYVKTTTAFG